MCSGYSWISFDETNYCRFKTPAMSRLIIDREIPRFCPSDIIFVFDWHQLSFLHISLWDVLEAG
jgi:hypothetical protein